MATMYPEAYIIDPFQKKQFKDFDIAGKQYDSDGEKMLFELFQKDEGLPQDYHVFHSMRKYHVTEDNILLEKETDFIIFHEKKGIICLEVKNADFYFDPDYRDYDGKKVGEWVLTKKTFTDKKGNIRHKTMSHFGPWHQAKMEAVSLRNCIMENEKTSGIQKRCKIIYAVWSMKMSKKEIANSTWPQEADPKLTLFAEDYTEALLNPASLKARIDELFDNSIPFELRDSTGAICERTVITELREGEADLLISEIFEKKFDIPLKTYRKELNKRKPIQFLQRQQQVLEFTSLQQFVAINGQAGTGKTLVAIKKAELLGKECDPNKNEQVLFLCLNSELYNHLCKHYKRNNVIYKTINHFISDDLCEEKKFNNPEDKNDFILNKLEEISKGNAKLLEFTTKKIYKHIIIDECQDFSSLEYDEESLILDFLSDALRNQDEDSCFYVFYDEYQRINCRKNVQLPKYIESADSKITLVTNCRNTKNIALASLVPMQFSYLNLKISEIEKEINAQNKSPEIKKTIKERRIAIEKNKIIRRQTQVLGHSAGNVPGLYLVSHDKQSLVEKIKIIIDNYLKDEDHKISDITILTAKAESKSLLKENDKLQFKYNGKSIPFFTVRQFKGCESKSIILVEVDKNTLIEEPMIYYVGASRAINDLSIIANLAEEDCKYLVEEWIKENKNKKNYRYSLASYLKLSIK